MLWDNLKILLTAFAAIFYYGIVSAQTPRSLPAAYDANSPVNYIRTWDAVKPESDANNITTSATPDAFKMTTQYFDGLGRPLQTVVKQGSLITGGTATDLVSTTLYDAFGRVQYQYLPSPANSTGGNTSLDDGMFKLNPFEQQAAFYSDPAGLLKGQGETFFYGRTVYEPSPLNRVTETFAPGNNWAGTSDNAPEEQRHSVKTKYLINTDPDGVRIWNVTDNATMGVFGSYSSPGAYPAGELYKTVTVDENGKQVIEFKDKSGLVVLKKVQLTAAADDGTGSGHTGWLCTYYIYDDLNRPRCVLQPKGVELIASNWVLTDATILAEQCFRYEYDQRQRMIVKKVPGAGEVNMVYDKRDRLVMTQDANMKAQNQWLVTQYDALNRPVETGIWTNATTAAIHRTNAAATYPYPATSGNYELLTTTHYDNYTGLPAPLTNYLSTWNSNFSSTDNNSYPYPQMPAASNATRGMVTWTSTKVLGTSTYLYAVSYYDDKGRIIQMQSTNITGGTDVVTTQYGWQGLPLIVVQKQQKADANPQTITTVTQNSYDELGRLIKPEKKLSHSEVNSGAMSAYHTVNEMEYDALGQVKTKKLAPEYDNNAGLETLDYDYNIRGWLLGANRDYVKDAASNNYFGFDLGYDKNGVLGSYTPQYNGNIAGTVWKSKGDGEKRKYDFTYDAVNRIAGADFNQYTGGSFNKTAGVDFSMSNMSYDANGNITSMNQKGLKINASPLIDQLAYTYQTYSNKLSQVTDAVNDNTSMLGDFKYDPATKGSTDYSYDGNGNLISDANKKISSITYNYLNLPTVITVTGKGTITYTYDATGNKLKKVTVDNTISPAKTTTTLYMGGTVFQNDTLQFITNEEGRIRPVRDGSGNITSFTYDYFLKDHLGNVRMVLTEQKDTSFYPPASMEAAQATTEEALYANLPQTRTGISSIAGYPTDNYTNPNAYVAKTNGSGNKIGPSIILKVMAGDQFNIRVSSWYKKNGSNPGSPNSIATDLVTSLINSLTGTGGPVHGAITSAQLTSSGVVPTSVNSFLSNQPAPGSTKPKAYINWILLDEQFKFVQSSSGAEQVGNDLEFKVHTKTNLPITKHGYLYVFVSNETPNIDVYWDNLQVTHTRGAILEETHYYPFGLTMAGISSKALEFGNPENKYKYNKGSELQSKEFSDGSGLELYATNLRSLDPQLGRWWQIDPKPDYSQSLYSAMGNSPILYNDPLGDTLRVSFRGGFLGLGRKREVIYDNGTLTNKDGSAYTGKVKGFLKQTVNSLNSGRTGSTEAASMITGLQGSANNFTIVKGTENRFDVNPSQRTAGYANQLKTDPALTPSLSVTPAAAMQGGAGGTITWNPSGAKVWVLGGGQNNNPTTNLMHELFHGRDANMGLLDSRLDNGLKRDEWQATYKENMVRQQMHLPIREYYRSQDNGGVITSLPPRLLDASNNPISPAWVPQNW